MELVSIESAEENAAIVAALGKLSLCEILTLTGIIGFVLNCFFFNFPI
jgi:hypothetical protein